MAKDKGTSWKWSDALLGQIIVGLTLQDRECQTIKAFDATLVARVVETHLLELFPFGSTRIRGSGIYRCLPKSGAAPVAVREDSVIVEVLGVKPWVTTEEFAKQVVKLARRLATTFQQREVLARVVHPNGKVCVAFIPGGASKNLNTLVECGRAA